MYVLKSHLTDNKFGTEVEKSRYWKPFNEVEKFDVTRVDIYVFYDRNVSKFKKKFTIISRLEP